MLSQGPLVTLHTAILFFLLSNLTPQTLVQQAFTQLKAHFPVSLTVCFGHVTRHPKLSIMVQILLTRLRILLEIDILNKQIKNLATGGFFLF